MHLRLLALLLLAAPAGVGAAAASKDARAAHVRSRFPALPGRGRRGAEACRIPHRFRSAFERAARKTGFQLSMLVAVAQESQFQPKAGSSADARGPLQVLPSTAASLRLDPNEPASNVLARARYLKILLDRRQSTGGALAAYNAGAKAIDRAGRPSADETLTSVANVRTRWRALAGCF
ncbi:MAG: lytic transglycosylase domain-containing protein [Gaiellaceae bacterium]